MLCSYFTVSSMWTNLEIIISKNSWILNQFSSPTVCLHQQWSRLSCAAADAIDFFLCCRVGVGRHRGGTANDGNFHNDSMLLQGAVLMVASVWRVGHGVTFRNEEALKQAFRQHRWWWVGYKSRLIIGAAYSNRVCVEAEHDGSTVIYFTVLIGCTVVSVCFNV